MKQRFFDEIDSGWEDLISDVYNNACKFKPKYIIQNNKKIIQKNKYYNDKSVKGELTLDDDLFQISDGAFLKTNLIGTLNIPENVNSIGQYAFAGCKGITEINLNNGLSTIHDSAFIFIDKVEELIIPDSVYIIGENAFSYMTNLKRAQLSNNLKTIDDGLFCKCINLEKVTLPNKLHEIRSFAFDNCKSLKELIIPESVRVIYDSAFADLNPNIIINNSLVKLKANHFTS